MKQYLAPPQLLNLSQIILKKKKKDFVITLYYD